MEYIKDDKDKLSYSLIDPLILESLAKTLTYGAKKYNRDNWKKCDDIDRYIDALLRHLQELRKGNLKDVESGLHHADHLLANAAFLSYFFNKKKLNLT